MRRENLRGVMWFVLVVMVCGGGCMSMPYSPGVKDDLVWVGLDDHTRARLDGLADPRPSDPLPVSHLSGKLLVYQVNSRVNRNGELAYYGWPVEGYASPKDCARLRRLAGISEVATLTPNWPEPVRNPDGTKTYPQIDPRRYLLEQARAQGGDLILLYTAGHDAHATDLTLGLAQILLLGFAPTVAVSADADLIALLIDAHSGYIYAIGQGKGGDLEVSNGWGRESSKREAASEAIQDALSDFVDQLEDAWPEIHGVY